MNSIIEITPAAQEQITHILVNHPGQVLVLGVNNKGCSGHSYTFELKSESELHKLDEVLQINDFKVAVDHKSVINLIGSTLDFTQDAINSKFVWHNPAVKHTCGCGISVGF